MNILHVVASVAPDWGGPATIMRSLAPLQVARGHEVVVVTTDVGGVGYRSPYGGEANPLIPGVDVRAFRVAAPRAPYLPPGMLPYLLRSLQHFDIAHVHGVFNLPVTAAMALCRLRGLPYILDPCGALDPYGLGQKSARKRVWLRLIERANIDGAAAVQVLTPHEVASLEAVGTRAPVVLCPHGVDQPEPPSVRPHERPYILFMGRIAHVKGLLRLVDAFTKVAAELPHDLLIVGPDEGGHEADVRARAAERGVADRVFFPGRAAGALKSAYFAHADAFVLPSESENFGVVVIEAAALGTPVVASDGVALAQEVAACGAGEVVPREAAALGEALVRVVGRGRAAYEAGLKELWERYRWERRSDALDALYREVLNRSVSAR